MKRALPLLVAALAAISPPLLAARVAVTPITHKPEIVFAAYTGSSNHTNCEDLGYQSGGWDTVEVVPGVLSIDPGDNWENYVKAAHESPPIPYSIKNVVLLKQTPNLIQCADIISSGAVSQHGTPNVRLWWPLMYETAGTTWTLTILYGTSVPYADGGVDPVTGAPNPAGYVHTEIRQWQVDVTMDSMKSMLALLHELPFGTSQAPLISDEVFYDTLQSKLDEVKGGAVAGDSVSAGLALGEFEMLLMDRCMAFPPVRPNPTGPGMGVAQSAENPACCKLLTDAEYVGFKLGIYQPRR